MDDKRTIDSPETMAAVIDKYGIIPFFKNSVPGWSIEEKTAPGYWFDDEEGELGPWDWKIDCVRRGDIAYGKFLGGKAGFATVEWYRQLMNWRRSIPKYRMALGERYKVSTSGEKLMAVLSPVALSAIREAGAMDSKELRMACSQAVTPSLVKSLGPHYRPLLMPSVKKGIVDSVVQFLQMGTWSVIGDFERVYRGPALTYSGWQRASNTTPEELFGTSRPERVGPAWARHLEGADDEGPGIYCQPEESREAIVSHIVDLVPGADRRVLSKTI